jgi:hypothetical protein
LREKRSAVLVEELGVKILFRKLPVDHKGERVDSSHSDLLAGERKEDSGLTASSVQNGRIRVTDI